VNILEEVLTQRTFDRMIAGQLQAQNPVTGECYRGEIRKIEREGETLTITFNWYAQMENDGSWTAFNEELSVINLATYGAEFIAYGRVLISSWEDPEVITLFPPKAHVSGLAGQEMLDPSKVRGLVLA
jgi:hypothetical protein